MNARRLITAVAAVALVAAACGNDDGGGEVSATGDESALEGLLSLTPGECSDDGATGTYFRMVNPDGTVEDGPYVENGDSPCPDITFTPLAPGSDGGLRLGEHQPTPDPAFDDAGNGVSDRILEPAPFFAVQFAVSTNPTDPQTGDAAEAPSLTATPDGTLSGNLAAFAASWNGQHFNQGAPKPDGTRPGKTTGPTGTYDADTGAIVVEWTSQIVGGPFNNFTGFWHLEGTFEGD